MITKISGFEPIKPAGGAVRRSGTSSVGSSSFADLLVGGAEEVAPAAPAREASPAAALTNLLAMQEITEEEVRRKKLIQQGRNTLDALENLRQQLLIGAVPMEVLRDLARNISVQKQTVTDPQLMALMMDIELRAAVELAKLEMAQKQQSTLHG